MHGTVPTNSLCEPTILSWSITPSKQKSNFPKSRHRAATTGSVGFIRLLIESSTPSVKLRLNTADRIGENRIPVNPYPRKLTFISFISFTPPRLFDSGNTPLHLAMDSAHAEAAVALINAGADRSRVSFVPYSMSWLRRLHRGLLVL